MKNTLAIHRLLGFLAATAMLTGCGGQASVSDDGRGLVHTIGVVAPLTGNGVLVGKAYVDGLEMAIKEHNDVSDDFLLRLSVQDGKLDPAESVAAVQAILAKDDPAAFAMIFALPVSAVNPILQEAEKPLIYEAYVRSPLKNPYTFKTGFDAYAGCRRLVQYAKDKGAYEKLALLMARTEYSEMCAEEIRKIEPGLTEIWYEYGQTDFRSLLYRLHEEGVDTLVNLGIDFEFQALFTQIGDLGYNMKMLCATSSECIFPDIVASARPDVLDGTLATDYLAPDFFDSPFARAYRAQNPDASNVATMFAAAGYDTGKYLADALAQCPDEDGRCIVEALERATGPSPALQSRGFTDHALELPIHLYAFENGRWTVIEE